MYIPQPCARRAHRNPTTHIDPTSVGMIYSIPTYTFKNVHSPTLRPKGAQKLSNLRSAPKCWHNISNTNLYFQLTYIPSTLRPKGAQKPFNLHSSPKCWHDIFNANIYIQKCLFSNPAPEGRTETLQLTFLP